MLDTGADIIKSQAMASSPFCKPFQDRISIWAAKLSKMQKILDEWLTTQVKWMYLGPVFGTDEISKKMPKERKEFLSADGKYRRIMLAVLNSPEVVNICGMDGLLEDLIESNKVLLKCIVQCSNVQVPCSNILQGNVSPDSAGSVHCREVSISLLGRHQDGNGH